MSQYLGPILIALIALLVVLSDGTFTVDQRQNALVFQLGEVVAIKTKPGLYFKCPLLQNVRYFDTRILTIDSAKPERFLTSEKKNVLVDPFIKWRITDARQYYYLGRRRRDAGGDSAEADDQRRTARRIRQAHRQ